MTHGLALLDDGQVILHIAGIIVVAIGAAAVVGAAALIQEELGKVEIARLAGDLVELDQPNLDFLVAGHIMAFAGAKDGVNQVGVLDRDVQHRALARGAIVGDRRFIEMADVVQLVVDAQMRPARFALAVGGQLIGGPIAFGDRAGRVEIAVRLLRRARSSR